MPRLKRQKINPAWSRRTLVRKRNEAADEVCNTLLLMMMFGGLEIPQEWRDFLGKRFQPWSDIHFYLRGREEDE